MARLEAGQAAPKFTLTDHDGTKVSLADFKGSKVIVYFYPKDDTPGCTKEACQFNENLAAFAAADVAVVGISPDGAEKHTRFREKYQLDLPLLSDGILRGLRREDDVRQAGHGGDPLHLPDR